MKLKRNTKIVNHIKSYSVNKKIKLVSFKFTNNAGIKSTKEQVNKLLKESRSDIVVQNDFKDRTDKNEQQKFNIFMKDGFQKQVVDAFALAQSLEFLLISSTKEK